MKIDVGYKHKFSQHHYTYVRPQQSTLQNMLFSGSVAVNMTKRQGQAQLCTEIGRFIVTCLENLVSCDVINGAVYCITSHRGIWSSCALDVIMITVRRSVVCAGHENVTETLSCFGINPQRKSTLTYWSSASLMINKLRPRTMREP